MDHVFSLIKSLSQSEKRYFVRFAKFQTPAITNSYLALFNRIVKEEKYDEKKLKQEFGSVHFAQLKQQLYRKLMQCLRLCYSTNSSQNEVFIHLHNYKLLTSRGLSVFAEKELRRSERIAHDAEMSHESAIVFRERNMLMSGMSNVIDLQARIHENENFITEQIATITNEHQYEKIFLEVEVLNKQLESTRNKEEMMLVTAFLENPLLINESAAKSLQSKIYFNFSKGLAHYLMSDYLQCSRYMRITTALLSENPQLLLRQEDLYIRALANTCLSCIHLNETNEFKVGFQKLEAARISDSNTSKYREYLCYLLQLMLLNKNKSFDQAVLLIESKRELTTYMEKKMTMKKNVSQEHVYSVFQQATSYLGIGMHKKASSILSKFIDLKSKGLKEDSYIIARLFFLCIRFELNNPNSIESEMRSIHRYLKEKNKLFLFEKHFLTFISKMLISTSTLENKRNFLALKTELEILKEIEFEKNAFSYFDFSNWINKFIQ